MKVEKNRFKQYFTSKQQSIETNSQARGIYADETGKVAANIWMHTFLQQDGKQQYVNDEEIKYALLKHNAVLYCGGYNLFNYNEEKNTISKSTIDKISFEKGSRKEKIEDKSHLYRSLYNHIVGSN